jgi:UDP-3-O-[3-hydroxymyristoyl] glucosamine N-acyltransferase
MATIEQIFNFSGGQLICDPKLHSTQIQKVCTWDDATEKTMVWIKKTVKNKQDIINNLEATLFIVPDQEEYKATKGKALIVVSNPRASTMKIISKFFVTKQKCGIHPTAYIHPNAIVHESCYIGPFSYIGQSTVGKNTVIHGNIHVYDNVNIGENVVIHSGTVIGADGFGFERDDDGSVIKFPHIGGVIIKNNVEIGANTCIDKGTLGNTIINNGVKIDNLVHIAHNVVIGENSFVIANSMVGGSTKIGKNVWVAPSVSLMNGISIGANVTVGMASLVTKSIPDGETWTGSPAKPLKEFIEIQNKLKALK